LSSVLPERLRAMSETEGIRAVELVRAIRDRQAQELSGKSDEELIEFFRRAGDAAQKLARERLV